MPVYKVVDESGPDHAKNFVIEVYINNKKWVKERAAIKKLLSRRRLNKH